MFLIVSIWAVAGRARTRPAVHVPRRGQSKKLTEKYGAAAESARVLEGGWLVPRC